MFDNNIVKSMKNGTAQAVPKTPKRGALGILPQQAIPISNYFTIVSETNLCTLCSSLGHKKIFQLFIHSA